MPPSDRDLAIVNAARILLEQCGRKASSRKIAAVVRAARGFGMRHDDVLKMLQTLATKGREPLGNHPGTSFEHAGNQSGTLRARDIRNGIRESKGDTSYLPGIVDEKAAAEKARKPPLPGHRILDAIVPLVAPHLEKMTVKTWRLRNATAAHAMAEGGITPGEAVEAWQAEFDRTERPLIVLRFLHDRMAAGVASPHDPYENFPLAEDL